MPFYQVWKNNSGSWLVYEVTNFGQNWKLIKTFRTKRGVESWAKKQWYRVEFT